MYLKTFCSWEVVWNETKSTTGEQWSKLNRKCSIWWKTRVFRKKPEFEIGECIYVKTIFVLLHFVHLVRQQINFYMCGTKRCLVVICLTFWILLYFSYWGYDNDIFIHILIGVCSVVRFLKSVAQTQYQFITQGRNQGSPTWNYLKSFKMFDSEKISTQNTIPKCWSCVLSVPKFRSFVTLVFVFLILWHSVHLL